MLIKLYYFQDLFLVLHYCQNVGKKFFKPMYPDIYSIGKSLDEIMKLKERAGNKDLYDVLKKMERRKKFQINSSGQDGQARVPREKAHVFDFINKKLGGKKGEYILLVI